MAKKKKGAIALSGGGPVVGIEIGALKAFEEKQILRKGLSLIRSALMSFWTNIRILMRYGLSKLQITKRQTRRKI